METPNSENVHRSQDLLAGQPEDSSATAIVLSTTQVTSGGEISPASDTNRFGNEELVAPIPARVGHLPVQMDVRVPLASFRVRDLLNLTNGSVLETEWPASEDLPLASGDLQLVWVEFEVIDQKLAARITRLA